ncbi:MAG: hypothetical protein ACFB0D_03560 [Phormidesmis sp.]
MTLLDAALLRKAKLMTYTIRRYQSYLEDKTRPKESPVFRIGKTGLLAEKSARFSMSVREHQSR